jgi:hypothetical protein
LNKLRCILFLAILLIHSHLAFGQEPGRNTSFNFFGDSITIPVANSFFVPYTDAPSDESVQAFYDKINCSDYQPIVGVLLSYKQKNRLNDWIFYQLIRKTAQQVAPKAENYLRYTLYKWFLLGKCGYDDGLAITEDKLIFFVRSDEQVFDIPYYKRDGKQYVCLNKHDYPSLDLENKELNTVDLQIPEGKQVFSYKVTQMPDFTPADYTEKDVQFKYRNKQYSFKLKVNPQVKTIFANYPVVDYASYFNIPLSKTAYGSLIPLLKKNVQGMKQKKGVDYLMEFTRNAFLYETDVENFGKEKRLSPEQTLLYTYSDCDDRAALFFYLVKEIYNLPMIAMLYPTHITIAVKFDKPTHNTIIYNGEKYSVCDPTPQPIDIHVGHIASEFRHQSFEVAYAYEPGTR